MNTRVLDSSSVSHCEQVEEEGEKLEWKVERFMMR
jgi:hypothetical protein